MTDTSPASATLAGIQAITDAASPGPWEVCGIGDDDIWSDAMGGFVGEAMYPNDAPFIAAARTAMPRLLAAIEALTAALTRHREWFTDSKGVMLCGGCLKPVPCPDDPDSIVERALNGKDSTDGH